MSDFESIKPGGKLPPKNPRRRLMRGSLSVRHLDLKNRGFDLKFSHTARRLERSQSITEAEAGLVSKWYNPRRNHQHHHHHHHHHHHRHHHRHHDVVAAPPKRTSSTLEFSCGHADTRDIFDSIRSQFDATDREELEHNPLYSKKNLLLRESLRFNPEIRAVMTDLWLVVDWNDSGALEKDEYIGLHRKLVRLVREGDDMTEEDEAAMAEKEWKADIRAQGRGGKSMSKLTVRS